VASELAPLLHILAGPNGAGKSTLYEADVRRRTSAEFVNADGLAFEALGHHALTQEEAELGQRLANERRAALMGGRQSLVTESTFSHPSKIDLVREAKAAGYRVVIYHVNVADAEVSVARVASRTQAGGHPVAEDRIRGRYARNGALIREAIMLADTAYVFDNTALALRPRQLITFRHGRIVSAAPDLPAWAAALYAEDLAAPARS
jgi:predicted ABC-type ATPase